MEKLPQDFDAFTTDDDGELISIDDVEKMFQLLVSSNDSTDRLKKALVVFAQEARRVGHTWATCRYLEKALPLTKTAGERARFLLTMGQVLEGSGDFKAALAIYTRAFELPPEQNAVWYYLNNNRANCLNEESRHVEAEMHCRAAIAINGQQHNAHKNLGVALQGQGRYAEAALSFAYANRLCPADGWALSLLKSLLIRHLEVLDAAADLLTLLHNSGTTEPIASCEDVTFFRTVQISFIFS
jgi:tetratricopeptide (TPR) repeat protein